LQPHAGAKSDARSHQFSPVPSGAEGSTSGEINIFIVTHVVFQISSRWGLLRCKHRSRRTKTERVDSGEQGAAVELRR